MKKVVLINPGKSGTSTAMPLGLSYLAAYIREKGHTVSVKDMEVEPDGLEEFLLKEHPNVVGITILTLLYPLAKDIIERVKRTLPSVKIVVGGPHVSAIKSEVMRDIPDIDVAVYGEGELTFAEILEDKPYDEIRGICYHDISSEGNKILTTSPRPFIEDIDCLPFPAWDLFPIEKYRIHPPYGKTNHFMNMITSRGCPFNCAYCSKNFGRSYRSMSPERVIEELKTLIKKFDIKEIHFYDDDFTMDNSRVEKICDSILKENIKISWSCTTRVDLVNFNLLKKMKESGCWLISFGVESGNQDILNIVRKGYTIEQVKNAFKWSKELKIKRLGFFMLGLPSETKETIEESVKLAKEIEADYTGWAITMILPGTDICGLFKERGAHIYSAPAESLAWLPQQGSNNYILFANEHLSHEELSYELRRISKIFYLNPKFMIKEFLQIRSLHELSQLIRAGVNIIKNT